MSQIMISRVLLIVVGSVLMVMFFYTAGKNVLFIKKSATARGKITRLSRPNGRKDGFVPTVEFSLPSGEKRSFTDASRSTSYCEGTPLTVMYDPAFPEDARIKSYWLWLAPAMLLAFGALLLFAGIYPFHFEEAPVTHEYAPLLDRTMHFLLRWVLPGGLVLFGSALVVLAVADIKKRLTTARWPTTDGTVVESKVNQSGKYYSPDISYTYRVDGKKYTSSRFSISQTESGNPLPSQRAVKRYPPKTKVRVFYNPENPEEGLLEPSFNFSHDLLLMFAGGAGFYLFAWIAFVGVRAGWLK